MEAFQVMMARLRGRFFRFSSFVSIFDRFLSQPEKAVNPANDGMILVVGLGNPGPEY